MKPSSQYLIVDSTSLNCYYKPDLMNLIKMPTDSAFI